MRAFVPEESRSQGDMDISSAFMLLALLVLLRFLFPLLIDFVGNRGWHTEGFKYLKNNENSTQFLRALISLSILIVAVIINLILAAYAQEVL